MNYLTKLWLESYKTGSSYRLPLYKNQPGKSLFFKTGELIYNPTLVGCKSAQQNTYYKVQEQYFFSPDNSHAICINKEKVTGELHELLDCYYLPTLEELMVFRFYFSYNHVLIGLDDNKFYHLIKKEVVSKHYDSFMNLPIVYRE